MFSLSLVTRGNARKSILFAKVLMLMRVMRGGGEEGRRGGGEEGRRGGGERLPVDLQACKVTLFNWAIDSADPSRIHPYVPNIITNHFISVVLSLSLHQLL